MKIRSLTGISLLTVGLVLSVRAVAADFSGMSNEELMQMQPQQMSTEEREQFRTEMRQRMQNMDSAEQQQFRNEMRSQSGGGRGNKQGGGQGGY
ncbi:DUF1104 domain-containing protein [Thiohalomonas denitrificans]|uniref:DUF1104 domain-containing protein n=1 Tax=Thiohalomonas denitrificans TaxID=415747 RepID=UPI0026F0F4B4|nr:DUF1104 domain-containing protein [Thiohalomonas denitrificans]